jgi:predicted glycosyltransferase
MREGSDLMRVLVDCATPKSALFFHPIIEKLKKRGCEVGVTTRAYAETIGVLERLGIEHHVLGKHGGETLQGKLEAHIERLVSLTKFVKEFKPQVVVNLMNPESSRVAFALNTPLMCFADIPEATHVAKLTIPLATKVFSPWIIPKKAFLKYGLEHRQIYQYHALDPVVWLRRHKVDENILEKLGLKSSKPVIVFRSSETKSAYLRGYRDLTSEAMKQLNKDKFQLLDIPRYKSHEVLDTQSLLAKCTVLIGGGGTMNCEAAYYGTPVIDCRAVDTYYMRFLRKMRLAARALTVEKIVKETEKAVKSGKNTEQAKRVFGQMEFPLKEITEIILEESKR